MLDRSVVYNKGQPWSYESFSGLGKTASHEDVSDAIGALIPIYSILCQLKSRTQAQLPGPAKAVASLLLNLLRHLPSIVAWLAGERPGIVVMFVRYPCISAWFLFHRGGWDRVPVES